MFFVKLHKLCFSRLVVIELAPHYGREEIITYECTSHPSNIKTLNYLVCFPDVFFFKVDLTLELALETPNKSIRRGVEVI